MGNSMSFYKDFEELKTHLAELLEDLGFERESGMLTDEALTNICYVQMGIELVMSALQEDYHVEFLKKYVLSLLAKMQIIHGIDIKEMLLKED